MIIAGWALLCFAHQRLLLCGQRLATSVSLIKSLGTGWNIESTFPIEHFLFR
jgi:hypothetical protein